MSTVPKTGMVVVTDLVEDVTNIHPPNKQDVGARLARWALAKDYDRSDVVFSGPMFRQAKVEDGSIRIQFDQVDGGLTSHDGKPLTHFLIAGEDKKYVSADATIDGASVVVHSVDVPKPVAVRFAWDELARPNLMNKAGLPANSFRSDEWPLDE
jgi:sialate O-acetylesterase